MYRHTNTRKWIEPTHQNIWENPPVAGHSEIIKLKMELRPKNSTERHKNGRILPQDIKLKVPLEKFRKDTITSNGGLCPNPSSQ